MKKAFFPFLVLFAAMLFLMPRSVKFGYDYKKGSEWKYETLFAQFSFPVLKSEEQILAERSAKRTETIPYYKYSDEITNSSLKSCESLLSQRDSSARPVIMYSLRSVLEKGIVSDEGVKSGAEFNSELVYVQKDKRAVKRPSVEVLKLSDARALLLSSVSSAFPSIAADSLLSSCGIYDLVVPNLIYDSQSTQLVASRNSVEVSPTCGYVSAGQVIVSEGEIITAEIAQILDSYKKEFESNIGSSGPVALLWLGNGIICAILVLLLFLAIYFAEKEILFRPRELVFVLFVVLLSAAAAFLFSRYLPHLIWVVPFSMTALYMQAFFERKTVLPVYVISLLPLLVASDSGSVMFVMFLMAGTGSLFVLKKFSRRWKQFVGAFVCFMLLSLSFLAFRLAGMVGGGILQTLASLFIGSMLTVACYPFVYLFERIFNLVSNARLTELCDTSGKLVHELEVKAPGTFQHSLQVMNLCEAAAKQIGANPVLVRAGALYHDIGKTLNPLCFVENESLASGDLRFHASLSPVESSRQITKHVEDGARIAEKHGLPRVIRDMILSHHGTTLMSFFYSKYLEDGGDPAEEVEFRYRGKKPVTKEEVILMVCDSLEAASRTLKDYSSESIGSLVDGIVADKMKQGQFDSSNITIREMGELKEVLKSYLAGIYHERIVYPENINQK